MQKIFAERVYSTSPRAIAARLKRGSIKGIETPRSFSSSVPLGVGFKSLFGLFNNKFKPIDPLDSRKGFKKVFENKQNDLLEYINNLYLDIKKEKEAGNFERLYDLIEDLKIKTKLLNISNNNIQVLIEKKGKLTQEELESLQKGTISKSLQELREVEARREEDTTSSNNEGGFFDGLD